MTIPKLKKYAARTAFVLIASVGVNVGAASASSSGSGSAANVNADVQRVAAQVMADQLSAVGAHAGVGSNTGSNLGHNVGAALGANVAAGVGAGIGAGLSASGLGSVTGPGSTNTFVVENNNTYRSNTQNSVTAVNQNHQQARAGDSVQTGNTLALGGGAGGSGSAANSNQGATNVTVAGSSGQGLAGASTGTATPVSIGFGITGPGSRNTVAVSNNNTAEVTTVNDITAVTSNRQLAKGGDSLVAGNTIATGVGGGGSAVNTNTGITNVGVINAGAGVPSGFFNQGMPVSFSGFGITGPGSVNTASFESNNFAQITNINDVTALSLNRQIAEAGSTLVVGNTLANVGGGGGTAANKNTAATGVTVANSGSNLPVGFFSTPMLHFGGFGITGPGSLNAVHFSTNNFLSINVINVLDLFNSNDQWAMSGDTLVTGNTIASGAGNGNGGAFNHNWNMLGAMLL